LFNVSSSIKEVKNYFGFSSFADSVTKSSAVKRVYFLSETNTTAFPKP